MKGVCISYLLFIGCFSSSADDIDSLNGILSSTKSKKVKALIHEELAWYFKSVDADSVKIHALKSIELANDGSPVKASAYNRLGDYYFMVGRYDSAAHFYTTCFNARSLLNDSLGSAEASRNVGFAYIRKGEPKKSMAYLMKARSIFLQVSNMQGLISTQSLLAKMELDMGNYQASRSLLQKNQILLDSLNDQSVLRSVFNSLFARYFELTQDLEKAMSFADAARIYNENHGDTAAMIRSWVQMGNINYQLKQLVASRAYYHKALSVLQKKPNHSISLKALGNLVQTWVLEGVLDSAKVSLRLALSLANQITPSISTAIFNKQIGDYYLKVGKADSSIIFFDKALKDTTISFSLRKDLYYNLSIALWQQGRFKESGLAHWQHEHINDSLNLALNKAKNYEILLTKEQHRNQLLEKERDIQLVQQKAKQTRLNFIIILGLALLVVAIAFIAYQREKHKKTIAKKEIDELLQKQELSSIHNILEIQERERNRIARDIHDKLGGNLSTVQYMFVGVQQALEKLQTEIAGSFTKAIELLKETGEDVRNLAHNLKSGPYEKIGLEAALKELVQLIEKSESIKCEFHTHNLPKFSTVFESNIYRMVQEMISNTLKHAQAKEISLQLLYDGGRLNILFEDNGKGFDTTKEYEGMGLKNISTRVEDMKGTFKIDSGRGVGTTYDITVPFKKSI